MDFEGTRALRIRDPFQPGSRSGPGGSGSAGTLLPELD
jgi:hypothetical protein